MLTSCVARISYLGNQFPTTNSTDVFNDKAAVKRPFEAVGKGYVQASLATTSAEKIKKSSKKAKLFGADAIVIENYFVVDHTAAVATAPDSSGRTLQETVSAASAMPNFNILFIRYQN